MITTRINIELEIEPIDDLFKVANILLKNGYCIYYTDDNLLNVEVPAFQVNKTVGDFQTETLG